MNIMGMGLMELAVVLLVAFLVLGPGRSIDMAKRTGRILGDLRRTFNEVTDAISAEEQAPPAGRGPSEYAPPAGGVPSNDEDRQRSHAQQPPPGVPSRPDLPDETSTTETTKTTE